MTKPVEAWAVVWPNDPEPLVYEKREKAEKSAKTYGPAKVIHLVEAAELRAKVRDVVEAAKTTRRLHIRERGAPPCACVLCVAVRALAPKKANRRTKR